MTLLFKDDVILDAPFMGWDDRAGSLRRAEDAPLLKRTTFNRSVRLGELLKGWIHLGPRIIVVISGQM